MLLKHFVLCVLCATFSSAIGFMLDGYCRSSHRRSLYSYVHLPPDNDIDFAIRKHLEKEPFRSLSLVDLRWCGPRCEVILGRADTSGAYRSASVDELASFHSSLYRALDEDKQLSSSLKNIEVSVSGHRTSSNSPDRCGIDRGGQQGS